MAKKDYILYKIITTAILVLSFFGLLQTIQLGIGNFSILYLSKSLIIIFLFIGAIGLLKYKNWGRIIFFIAIILFILLGYINGYIFMQAMPELLLVLMHLAILGALFFYFYNKKINEYFINGAGRCEEKKVKQESKIVNILNRDIFFWLNIIFIILSSFIVFISIYKIIRNVIRLEAWCPRELMLIKVDIVFIIAMVIIIILIFVYRKYQKFGTTLILINCLFLLVIYSGTTFSFGSMYTQSKEECLEQIYFIETFKKGNVSVCDETIDIKKKNSCYNTVGIKNRDHAICDKIQGDIKTKNWCNIVVASYIDNYDYCERFYNDDKYYRQCYERFASQKKDYKICDNMRKQQYIEACYKAACGPILAPANYEPNNIEQNSFCEDVFNRKNDIESNNSEKDEKVKIGIDILNWKVYQNERFEILIPSDWQQNPKGGNSLVSKNNEQYYLNYTVSNIDNMEDSYRNLYKGGKLNEVVNLRVKNMCSETSSCGKIIQINDININNGVGIEFIVRYQGLRIDEPRGYINEIHQTILVNNEVYRFWTSEQVAPEELKNEYPKLDPTPIEIFREIMVSFKFIDIDIEELQETIAKNMVENEIIKKYLINLCHYSEENCGEIFFYKWKKQDEDNMIAFLSNLDEEKWKSDPFNYSAEIYIVDFKKGDVSRQSPFDGTFDYVVNIFK